MAIAANYRKHPEAMAVQMVLPFGRLLVWALPRPTTRILRGIRSERAAMVKTRARIVYPVRKCAPAWAREAAKNARTLADFVRKACMTLC